MYVQKFSLSLRILVLKGEMACYFILSLVAVSDHFLCLTAQRIPLGYFLLFILDLIVSNAVVRFLGMN